MTTVSLSELLDIRDSSLRARRQIGRTFACRTKAVLGKLAPTATAGYRFVHRHTLTLAGCTSVVTSAAIVSPALGWLAAGATFFFLELRRKDER